MALGYRLQGGMAQYALIGPEVLEGDDGNYLLPVRPETGYSQAALCEPWACVLASYRLSYRRSMKPAGTAWFIGNGEDGGFTLSAAPGIFDASAHPARVVLTRAPGSFQSLLEGLARTGGFAGGVTFEDRGGLDGVSGAAADLRGQVDDLIFLGAPRPEVVTAAMGSLARWGLVNILAERRMAGPTVLDIGQDVHQAPPGQRA